MFTEPAGGRLELVAEVANVVLKVFENGFKLTQVVGIDLDQCLVGFEGGFGGIQLAGRTGFEAPGGAIQLVQKLLLFFGGGQGIFDDPIHP